MVLKTKSGPNSKKVTRLELDTSSQELRLYMAKYVDRVVKKTVDQEIASSIDGYIAAYLNSSENETQLFANIIERVDALARKVEMLTIQVSILQTDMKRAETSSQDELTSSLNKRFDEMQNLYNMKQGQTQIMTELKTLMQKLNEPPKRPIKYDDFDKELADSLKQRRHQNLPN